MTLRYSKRKIEAALQLLAEFEAASFPHRDSTIAVGKLKKLLQLANKKLDAPVSPPLLSQTEIEATELISESLELLGVITNSANVRNSFEIHGPFFDLASTLLSDRDANLIISFEWDYIPYTYPQSHPFLPSFVIIGLPASEASNALVLPAIGHELGHSLWRRERFKSTFAPELNKEIISLIKDQFKGQYNAIFNRFGITADKCDDYQNIFTWAEAEQNGIRQVEELFSDFTGLFLFGAGYMDAFEYLLSPTLSTERHPEYPSVSARAKCLQDNASSLQIPISADFASRFADQSSPFRSDSIDQLQLELADAATDRLVTSIADRVFDVCRNRNVKTPSDEETDYIVRNFLLGVPAEKTSGLGAIVNAGWSAFRDDNFMKNRSDANRMSALNELILKSVEVYEIERMTAIDS